MSGTTPPTRPLCLTPRHGRFPNLGNFALQAGAANSNYNALILRTEKRLSSGLAVMGSYTFSKSIDNDSLGNTVVSGLGQTEATQARPSNAPCRASTSATGW